MKYIMEALVSLIIIFALMSCDNTGAAKYKETLGVKIDGTVDTACVTFFGCKSGETEYVTLPYTTSVEIQHGERCSISVTNTKESGVIKISAFNLSFSDDDIGIAPNGVASITYWPGID